MNNIHQVIFNKSTQQFVVVSELAKSARKPKAVSADSVNIVSILQNFSEKRPLGTTNSQTNRSDNKSSSWSVGVFVGKSQGATGFGVEGAVNVGKGHSNSDSTVQNLTEINSDSLKINTKETTTLKGAVANVKHLSLDTKNLHIESVQDTEKYDSKQTQAGVSGSVAIYGSGWGLSSQASQNKAKVNYAQVNQQSGFNIQENANINVQENTHIKGGMINAQGDKANHQMTTGTLTTEEIENRSDVKVSSVSVSMSSEMSKIATSAIGAALSALGNMRESERSQTKAAISDNINLTITDSEAQKQKTGKTAEETLQSLNRDTENANQAVKKADLVAIQEKQETVQVIGELSQSWTNRLVQPHLEEANKKRQEAEKIEKSDPLKSAQLKAEAQAIEAEYGLGSNLQMGIRAATAALQGLATGNANHAAVGLLSPYANKLIKEQTGDNTEANLIAHTVLGAVEAHITGNNATAGALGAFTAEAAAPYLMQALYNTDKAENLTESQKQNIANLSQIAAGLAGGVTGDSTADFISGAEIGKRAVENNYLSHRDVYAYQRALKKAIEKGESVEEVHKYFKELSEKQRAELLADCEIDCRVTVPQTLLGAVSLADDLSGALNSWVQGLPFEEQGKFYQLVEAENLKTIEAIKEKQTGIEKGIELAMDTSRLFTKENNLSNSNIHSNFAKKNTKPDRKAVDITERISAHKTNNFVFDKAPYHSKVGNSIKSANPTFGQEVLNESIQVKATSTRRVGVDKLTGEYVVFDQTEKNIYHGHVRNWNELTTEMKNALKEAGLVNDKGKIK
ncbi:VENN motif pre-toxin domain-containing protein [Mannheimia pernigra]|uniref:VENN motif pre-toxin domain-containing protein n=1 Tax=Mannheimia pernigra TaxID=111844 RepID=A0ABD7A882_9PAST|nr:VENN motif pre-toxin domain-containing protein [Mannheimia pernigra]QLB42325.1 VENN motif pre-toxin domain-containing protein [Mannheimia pernigra]